GMFYRVWADNTNPSMITPANRALPAQELAFAAVAVTHDPPPVVALSVTPDASSVVAGTSFSVTVSALDASGQPNPSYTGTGHFTSTDAAGTLPDDYTFTVTDNGVHSFSGLILRTAGSSTLSATDSVTTSITGSCS